MEGANTRTTMTTLTKILLPFGAIVALGSLAFAVDTTPAPAGNPAPTRKAEQRIDRWAEQAARKLELTEAQRAALKEIVQRHQSELQPLRERMRAERQELRAIVTAEKLDEPALQAQAAKIGETTRALTVAQSHLRADLRTILTPDQIDTLAEVRRHRMERRHRHRAAPNDQLSAP